MGTVTGREQSGEYPWEPADSGACCCLGVDESPSLCLSFPCSHNGPGALSLGLQSLGFRVQGNPRLKTLTCFLCNSLYIPPSKSCLSKAWLCLSPGWQTRSVRSWLTAGLKGVSTVLVWLCIVQCSLGIQAQREGYAGLGLVGPWMGDQPAAIYNRIGSILGTGSAVLAWLCTVLCMMGSRIPNKRR